MGMWKLRSVLGLLYFLLLFCSAALVAAQQSGTRASRWQTLSGDAPLVIARGGFSGLFPDSSIYAYSLAVQTGLPNLHVWCDVQLTKDGAGICFPDIRLQNASDIDNIYKNRQSTYLVNGVQTQGWFAVDFNLDELIPVNMKQRIYSRAPHFDLTPMQILRVEDVFTQIKPPGLWLNVAHDIFFGQHNLSMRSFLLSVSRSVIVNYISSPEVGFLRSIISQFRTGPTKLVLQFLGPDDMEPSTNQNYSSLLRNFTLIKTFATGILVPKYYIWPVDNSQYLQNYESLVVDAHAAGLEVFASDFVNDASSPSLPYDYSYDPVAEYLNFIDNGKFSVDGVLSDFPITASETVDCFSHMGKNDTVQANILVISSEGASGDYAGCTDVAYSKAVSDGVDMLDCPVQITNDGVPFCLGSINLRDRTTVVQSSFSNLATNNPDLNIENGVFAYNLTWNQIQTLRPAIFNPYSKYSLYRNPTATNDGKLMQLSEFLAFANSSSSVSGVLISIENAAYLAEKQGLGVTDAVLDALSKAGYNNQRSKKVMIQSSDSAVLSKFKSSSSSNYELVYLVDEDVRDILNSAILDIKNFASSVVLTRESVFPTDDGFVTGQTSLVPKLQAFDLKVYVQLFRNEFVSQPWDFLCDPYVHINTHVLAAGINGVVTDFPATAAKYKRNRCLEYEDRPSYMAPVLPGSLISVVTSQLLPPAEAPYPVLTENNVSEPPLPPVMERPSAPNGSTAPGPAPPNGQPTFPPPNGQPKFVSSALLSVLTILLAAFVLC